MNSLIEEKDLEKFKKLKISNILELSIIAPIKYYDYRLKSNIIENEESLFFIDIKNLQKTPKYLKIDSFCINLNRNIELLFFRYNSYHLKEFSIGKKIYIFGKIQKNFHKLQIIQPKKVNEKYIGEIFPVYKTNLRADIFKNLIKKYIKEENFLDYKIPQKYVKNIFLLHNPNENLLQYYFRYKSFPKEINNSLKFIEIYNYMNKLAKKKKTVPSIMQCNKEIDGFLKNIPFKLTHDQLKAIKDIKNDLSKKVAARRVVIGDVGSGKSMVMFATAYLAYPNRAILMAPTTILANQLYEEAKKYLPNLKIALVTSSSKEKNLENFDFIIGTHALLYKNLPKACVIMVDEQHRFGTNQRDLLNRLISSKNGSPHYFQFSATPIPRTKALIDSSLVDFSFIKETPFKKDITTKVISKEDFKDLIVHIKNEINKNHQILIVYPLIESSENYKYKSLEEAASFWRKYFKNVYITHGKDKDKEEILLEFRDKGDILLATTVIEVGISLPRLSTVVIVGAENLGLATLHQLRGRVSRTGIKGYCYLYTEDKENKRLNEFSKISSGFDIAELDLKYRQSGDILSGTEQSGKTFKWIDLSEDKEIIESAKRLLINSN
ncbi:ATP-dependent DNA helicase RecG [Nitrosophilus kaiyonis]|uniref:ATP-dependent DNA helicase RecG n=1 Tax=Nitrosophilus kaiyonis TaxID=2930200 RepID=UPI002490B255|nr:ATP-dependent DNA helicase RecG [Nitrosophilus kaiyonis]